MATSPDLLARFYAISDAINQLAATQDEKLDRILAKLEELDIHSEWCTDADDDMEEDTESASDTEVTDALEELGDGWPNDGPKRRKSDE